MPRSEESRSLDEFGAESRRWLSAQRTLKNPAVQPRSRAVFANHGHDEERELIDAAREWQRAKYDCGFGAITWPASHGGANLSSAHQQMFAAVEQEFSVARRHELIEITVGLMAPTIDEWGDDAKRAQFVRSFLRADQLCCQLFSEPGAGSDLASLATRARRADDGGWIVSGQKIWTSGAQFADWGLLIARSDLSAPKHKGLTAFLVPMSAPGIDTRPIRQMSGGSSFNEVFLTDVFIDDSQRLGDEGSGWAVALTVLRHERNTSADVLGVGGSAEDLLELLGRSGRAHDPHLRRRIGEALARERAATHLGHRYAEREQAGIGQATDGSIGKLIWTQNMTLVGEVAAEVLGPLICADTGIPDTFAWSEHLLGAPGYRIAGGSDEIQHNIIGERALGLAREP